jgi:hypothetical protein
MKPVPETLMVSAAPPMAAVFGFNALSVGAGFCGGGCVPEAPLPPHLLQPSAQMLRQDTSRRRFQRWGGEVCQEISERRRLVWLTRTGAT